MRPRGLRPPRESQDEHGRCAETLHLIFLPSRLGVACPSSGHQPIFSWPKKIKYVIEGARLLERVWMKPQEKKQQMLVFFAMLDTLTPKEKALRFEGNSFERIHSIKESGDLNRNQLSTVSCQG